jgi:hypothetical protein
VSEAKRTFAALRLPATASSGLVEIVGDPLFKNLFGDPRYKTFLRKMNLPE